MRHHPLTQISARHTWPYGLQWNWLEMPQNVKMSDKVLQTPKVLNMWKKKYPLNPRCYCEFSTESFAVAE